MIWIVGTIACIAISIPFALALLLPNKLSARTYLDQCEQDERDYLARKNYGHTAEALADDLREAA